MSFSDSIQSDIQNDSNNRVRLKIESGITITRILNDLKNHLQTPVEENENKILDVKYDSQLSFDNSEFVIDNPDENKIFTINLNKERIDDDEEINNIFTQVLTQVYSDRTSSDDGADELVPGNDKRGSYLDGIETEMEAIDADDESSDDNNSEFSSIHSNEFNEYISSQFLQLRLRNFGVQQVDSEVTTCSICYEVKLSHFPITGIYCNCPNELICFDCLKQHVTLKINDHILYIPCPGGCDLVFSKKQVLKILKDDEELREKYKRYILDERKNSKMKTCPGCNKVTKKPRMLKKLVTCENCQLEWCFKCHAPKHDNISCKKLRKQNKENIKVWAEKLKHDSYYSNKEVNNAVKCPGCKVFTEKFEGCNNMQCPRCQTEYCYQCGDKKIFEKYIEKSPFLLFFFGTHRRRCKFCPRNKAKLSRFIRCGIVGLQILAIPLIIAALAALGGIVIALLVATSPCTAPCLIVYCIKRKQRSLEID